MIRLMQKVFARAQSLSDKLIVPRIVRQYGVEFDSGTRFLGLPIVSMVPHGAIRFGRDCLIISRQKKNLLTGPCRFVLFKQKAQILLGNNVGVSGLTLFACESISIGDRTIVGSDCVIVDSDFHPIDPQARLIDRNRGARVEPVEIGENTFIGAKAIILRGTTIGSGSVVAAGAVVKGKYPDNSLVSGNPARVIRQLDKKRNE